MKRNFGTLLCAVSLIVAVAPVRTLDRGLVSDPGPQAQPQRPIFRSDAHFVTVDAYPLRDGTVVEGLTVDDFAVFEDGRPQKIDSFEFVRASERITNAERRDPNHQGDMLEQLQDPRARAFVVYLDVDHVGLSGAYYGRQPIVELFHRILAPGDLIALTTSRNNPRDLTFGRGTEVVEQQLRDHWTWRDPDVTVTDAEEGALAGCYPEFRHEPLVAALVSRRRQLQLLENLEGVVDYLGLAREGRKTVFLFSSGWEWATPDPSLLKIFEGRRPSSGPTVSRGTQIRPTEPARGLRVEDSLIEGSRGACEQEVTKLSQLDNGPRFRALLTAARLNNVVVYPVNTAGVGASGARNDRLMELASHTDGTAVYNRNDLVQGVIDVSREFEAYYLLGYASDNTKTDGALRRIDVKVKTPGIEVKARRGYRALSKAEAESKAAAIATPVSISAERAALDAALDLLAGVRVGDDGAFDLRRYLRAGLEPHLGAPVVSRATPSPRSPIVPITAPIFRRNERLHVEWPITQAVASRTARIIGRDGNPVGVAVVLTEREGSPTLLVADAVLGALGFGDYALELTITVDGGPKRALLAFRVVP